MISVEDASVQFRMDANQNTNLKHWIVDKLKGKQRYTQFHALDHVNVKVEQGQTLGLIGHNGSGKSTLLKLISGIYTPSSGRVTTNGTIAPMLELGSGFDIELTGKENVFLNGAILGYTEQFLNEKYDEILAFSGLGDFINMPIKTYSSGMMMRLAFSVATVIEPEILIVDEILAVGDADFQQKSRARMMEMMRGGTTVLFVSHDLDQIRELSDHVLWLDHGKVKMYGDTEEVCNEFAKHPVGR